MKWPQWKINITSTLYSHVDHWSNWNHSTNSTLDITHFRSDINVSVKTHNYNQFMALNTGQVRWPISKHSLQSFTPYLCWYYSTSLINFFYLLWSIGSILSTYLVLQSFFHNCLGLWSTSEAYPLCLQSIHFSSNHYSPLLKHVHTNSTCFAVPLY